MTEQQQQGEVLAVHSSQLTTPNLAWLAREGYGILPDQSGWLVFVRVPQQASGDGRRASEGPADGARTADAMGLAPNAHPLTPDGLDAPDVSVDQSV